MLKKAEFLRNKHQKESIFAKWLIRRGVSKKETNRKW